MQNPNKPIWFNEDTYQTIQQSTTKAEVIDLPTEPKPVQIGVRFEAPQHHFQKLIDISYDFKLYRKFDDVSLRSFCTNNNAAYVAVEETYGDHSYNGHAKKDEAYRNDMTNFGILMEIRGIDKPFDWSREAVKKLQVNGTGTYYSPSNRIPSQTSEGDFVRYGDEFYELTKLSEPVEMFGQNDFRVELVADGVKARKGTFNMEPHISSKKEFQ